MTEAEKYFEECIEKAKKNLSKEEFLKGMELANTSWEEYVKFRENLTNKQNASFGHLYVAYCNVLKEKGQISSIEKHFNEIIE